jgi:hypothetical protein
VSVQEMNLELLPQEPYRLDHKLLTFQAACRT